MTAKASHFQSIESGKVPEITHVLPNKSLSAGLGVSTAPARQNAADLTQ